MKDVEIYIGTSLKGSQHGTGRVMYLMRTERANGTPYESTPEVAEYDDATESSLTLHALVDAINRLNYACRVNVHAECVTVTNAISQDWLDEWSGNGWHTAKGAEVKNADLWQLILTQVKTAGHELTAQKGKHEWTGWMNWNMPLSFTLKSVFKALPKT